MKRFACSVADNSNFTILSLDTLAQSKELESVSKPLTGVVYYSDSTENRENLINKTKERESTSFSEFEKKLLNHNQSYLIAESLCCET